MPDTARRHRPVARVCLALCAALLLVACEDKATKENLDKVQVGMTQAQVEDILGAGTDDTSSGGFGISGAGIGDVSKGAADKTFIWKTASGGKIVVVYSGGKVVGKQMVP